MDTENHVKKRLANICKNAGRKIGRALWSGELWGGGLSLCASAAKQSGDPLFKKRVEQVVAFIRQQKI